MKTSSDYQVMKIALATLTGTTAMTIFSYLLSAKKHKQLREPEVLNKFLKRSGIKVHRSAPHGWVLHYLAGLMFVLGYDQLWRKTRIEPSITQSIGVGAISGVAGVGIWKLLFAFHKNPPAIDRKKYFGQLITAHVIFGLFASIGYKYKGLIK